MKIFIISSLFLHALNVAANPLRRDVDNEAVATTIVTVTATLYATLVPPVLPAVTVSATYTQAVYTSTSTLASVLNCTTTIYSPIIAPVNSTAVTSPVLTTLPAVKPTALHIPEGLEQRQVPTSPSLTPTSATPTSVTSATSEAPITASVFVTVTATYSQTQRPPYTRTIYSILTATESTPLVRTQYACSSTLEVFYSIVTDVVTSTLSRTYWPSTTTVVSYTDCASRPTAPASSSVLSTSVSKPPVLLERQVAPATAVYSTTATQTRVAYVVTTITETGPSTRVVRSCSPTAASTSSTSTA